jgi:fimbrial isopeptide formation D2 family protein
MRKKEREMNEARMKKVFAVLLILSMVLSFAAPAFAEDDPRTSGTLTITKTVLNRLPATGTPGDGTQNDDPTLGNIDGIEFVILRVVPSASETTMKYGDVYYESAGDAAIKVSTVGGVAYFANLPLGVYYVTETPNPEKVADPSRPFFVSIPTIIDEEGEDVELFDVYAYPKNEDIEIEKVIIGGETDGLGKGVSIGDIVTYMITVDVPTDIAHAQSYSVTDTYSTGLQFVTAAPNTISAVAKSNAQTTSNTLTSPTDFVAAEDVVGSDGGTLTIDFNNLAGLAGVETIEITLSFKVLDTASLNEGIPNEATLVYENEAGTVVTREIPDIPEVFTGGIKIFKHDSVITDLPLEGATFVLVKKTSDDYENDMDNVYKRADGSVYEVTSGADGIVTFIGIPYGEIVDGEYVPSTTEYWLVETDAPDGYRKPGGEPKVIEINGSSMSETITVTVGNVKGFDFPLTGGTGTMLFIAGGLALIGMALGLKKLNGKERKVRI